MNPLESRLRRTLQQPQPPADLGARVLARAREVRRRRKIRRFWQTTAALLLVGLLGFGVLRYKLVREERAMNERATQQLIEALSLASQQLRPFQEQLTEMKTMTISVPPGDKGER